jgi:prepilin peptidase CpaA
LALAIEVVLAALALAGALYDLRWRRIPNWLVLAGAILGIGLNSFLFELAGLRSALLGLGLAFLVYFPLYLLRAMGAGDVKLMMAIGSLVGWRTWLLIFILSALAGGVIGIVVILWRRRLRKTLWNVGFLVDRLVHFQAPYLASEELDVRSQKSVRLPHGLAIAAGTGVWMVVAYIQAGR